MFGGLTLDEAAEVTCGDGEVIVHTDGDVLIDFKLYMTHMNDKVELLSNARQLTMYSLLRDPDPGDTHMEPWWRLIDPKFAPHLRGH